MRELHLPDTSAIKQSNNLYTYCLNDPINYTDKTGEVAVTASVLAIVSGVALAVIAALTVVSLVVLTVLVVDFLADHPSYLSNSTYKKSDGIKWGADKNKRNHIAHGSNKNHDSGWRKLGIDPNDPNFYDKVLPILKMVVNTADEIGRKVKVGEGYTQNYVYYLVEKGVKIVVTIYIDKNGNRSISNAWTTGI